MKAGDEIEVTVMDAYNAMVDLQRAEKLFDAQERRVRALRSRVLNEALTALDSIARSGMDEKGCRELAVEAQKRIAKIFSNELVL
jgi:hypothetical protein